MAAHHGRAGSRIMWASNCGMLNNECGSLRTSASWQHGRAGSCIARASNWQWPSSECESLRTSTSWVLCLVCANLRSSASGMPCLASEGASTNARAPSNLQEGSSGIGDALNCMWDHLNMMKRAK
eukprot:5997121-Alexandrium_andersonii.AAC.1